MSRLVATAFSLTGFVLLVAAAAVWVWVRPRSTSARRALVAIATGYLLASVYAVPFAVASVLSAGYRPFGRRDAPPAPAAIVVLGAGEEFTTGRGARLFALNVDGASRALEASRIFNMMPSARVITSGGVTGDLQPSSVTMRDALIGLNVPATRIEPESRSLDTREDAVRIAPILRSMEVAGVVLVTSRVHMRRALGTFRAVGVAAVPAVAPDIYSWMPRWLWFVPTGEGLAFSGEVVHELLGIPYYWARGWWRS